MVMVGLPWNVLFYMCLKEIVDAGWKGISVFSVSQASHTTWWVVQIRKF